MTVDRTASTMAVWHDDLSALARRVLAAVEYALVPHTPDDRHTDAAARAAVVATLRVLVADETSRLTSARRAHYAALITEIASPDPTGRTRTS